MAPPPHPPTDSVAIHAQGITKSYRSNHVLQGVDLTVPAGETFAILGPNGAGKTTFVEILEGFRKPTSGTATVLGANPATGSPAWRARVGIVLQELGNHETLTVQQALSGMAVFYRHHRRLPDLIEQVGLTDKATSRVGKLSGGQRRRLDVAIAILGYPEVLFVDEPTTGFDPQARRQFWDMLRALQREEGTTVILTTHFLDEAEVLAHRIGILLGGRFVAVDTPDKVGRSAAGSAEVSWTDNGQSHRKTTDSPTALVADLAARFKGEIPDLRISRPTLEDVYLDMVAQHAAASTTAEDSP